ncbi:Chitin synthase, class 2 [Podila humilis]|nr:Chitin synthase, class 2 [Podila humilis]
MSSHLEFDLTEQQTDERGRQIMNLRTTAIDNYGALLLRPSLSDHSTRLSGENLISETLEQVSRGRTFSTFMSEHSCKPRMPNLPFNPAGRHYNHTGTPPRRQHFSPGSYPTEAVAGHSPKKKKETLREKPSGVTAISPPIPPTLTATATPRAPGQYYAPMTTTGTITGGPSRFQQQYYPLSQWLQAPWLRVAMNIPNMPFPSMSMPVPMHYVFKPKQVRLTDGNLVLDTPVPTSYLSAVDFQSGVEFEKMRYMAVTCDADQVPEGRYQLRPQVFERKIELAICLTESPQEFCLTLHSLIKNIKHMCWTGSKSRAHRDPTWGAKDSWEKIVICVVADGRKNLDPLILRVLATMGCWQEGVAKNQVNGNAVQAHIFEYSTQVSVDSKLRLRGRTLKNSNKDQYPPVQIILCLKERHTKKLNSHRWFFNALCPLLQPKITLLTTAGAKIGKGSLYDLWHAFDRNPNTAGACGEIRVAKGLLWWKVLNPLIAAQIFEYKVSSVLEKPFESIFGYISVMPSALVAYRYEALLPEPISGKGPLTVYFEPDYLVFSDDHQDVGEVLQYSYFSEDQILPFLVTTRPHAQYTMQYVKSAWAETELPAGIGTFLGMKRKWQNRRFFGAIYAVSHVSSIWKSGHNFLRKLWLTLEIIYIGCDTAFWFLALGNYYLVFYYMSKTLASASKLTIGPTVFQLTRYFYIFLIVVVIMISMGNRPRGQSLYLFILSFIFFACIQAYILFSAGYLTFLHATEFLPYANWNSFPTIVEVFKAAGYHVLILALFLLLMPSYVSVLGVYAFCNMHEVNWGIKEPDDHDKDPMISRDAIYHASTVVMPDEHSVASSYQDALDDLDRKKRPKYDSSTSLALTSSSSTSLLPTHSDSATSLLVKKQHPSQPPQSQSKKTLVPVSRKADIKTLQADYYRSFRTQILLLWIVANGALVITISSDQLEPSLVLSDGSNLYVTIVVWIITVGAAGRFLGSVAYLLGWIWQRIGQFRTPLER